MAVFDYVLIAIAAIMSALAVVETVRDKAAAKRNGRRTSEATLLWLAAFGGAAAELIVMLIIRHKTRRLKFMLGLPAIILLHALLAYVYIIWLRPSLL